MSSEIDPAIGTASDQAFGLERVGLLNLLASGDIELLGRMPNSSNLTTLVKISDSTNSHHAIYKPVEGERPLHDFPPGLHKREVAMFELDSALGFGVTPPTVLREGPLGEGSVQAFVNANFEHHYFSMFEQNIGLDDLAMIALLDLVANNTDRKSGHCLLGGNGRIYGIDNGLSFHAQFKLRTVIWDLVGQPIPQTPLNALTKLSEQGPPKSVSNLLDTFEVDALTARTKALVELGEFPPDDTDGRRWPWPLV